MKIEIRKFVYSHFVELAIDSDSNVYLLGIPFDFGGSGHTRYFEMTQQEFTSCVDDEHNLAAFVKDGSYLGGGNLYWSDFAPDMERFER